MRSLCATVLALAAAAPLAASDAWLDAAERALTFTAMREEFRARLTGTLTAEGYAMSRPTPGLVYTESRTQFTPRLTLFADAQLGSSLSGFAQMRVDRGFDPSNGPLRGRIDELAVRWTPWRDGRFNLQVGQFGTVIGNWVPRHDPRDNPFVTAPLPYEHLTTLHDAEIPSSPADLAEFEDPEKYEYLPLIWGPVYSSGVAVAGKLGRFTLAAELKNTGPSAHPHDWSIKRTGFEHPAFAARLGFRPELRWNLGVSFSDSIYLLPNVAKSLPAGRTRGDYRQRMFGADLCFAWRHLQVWAEYFDAYFDVPRVGKVRSNSGYVEGKYKFTAQLYGALRLNAQGFSRIVIAPGVAERWARDIRRVDVVVGYRFTAHTDAKLQASVEDHRDLAKRANLNGAAQFNVRF
ncbi:MAG: hypothetical protein JNL39_03825 [Opitutaceae bacterium]|nr:hypothetical protein [Opitutaceae bacterium]